MNIRVVDIRNAAHRLFEYMEESGRSTVDVPWDYYWCIPRDARYDPTETPSEFTIGQLSDDLGELQKIIDGQKEPIGYALVWLASVCRALGEATVG